MTLAHMDVTVSWIDCGQVNGFYINTFHDLVMCNEVGDLAPYVAAHEMGHAIIEQLDLPVVGSEEAAADELGALALIDMGFRDEVLKGAIFWMARTAEPDFDDEHPENKHRGYVLACLEDGSETSPTSEDCQDMYRHRRRAWQRLITMAEVERL